MDKETKKQHYVFQGYLRPWAEDELIYCLRDGKIFQTNLNGVACERFFYEIQNLTPQEIEVVMGLFSDHPSQALKQAQKDFLSIYSQPMILRSELDANAPGRIRGALDRMIREGEESLHQKIEDDLLVFIRMMLAGDTSFYSDNEQTAKFLHAICVQYTRTKQIREATTKLTGTTFRGCDVRRMMSVLAPLMAMAVAQSLYIDKEQFMLVLLENDTNTPFITADQPIINLHHSLNGKAPLKFELYYPLSPSKAMLLVEKGSPHDRLPGSVSINNYNVMMLQNSCEQVFSNSEEYLSSLKSVIRSG
jgi:hypothetical protein